ncbi:MAG: hypothetical protein E7360_05830 [Clostridiales bacterium]|nr:hypothetical protein [Clostridiales bacterium]
MKKFIALFSIIILFNFSSPLVKADDVRYSRIISSDVVLYMDSSLTIPWFTLPLGYYVKVLSINASTVKVEYKGDSQSKPSVKGYLSVDNLSLCEEIPQTLSPNLVLTVNQTTLLYKDVDFSLTETIGQNSTVDFYGVFEKNGGNKYIYGLVTASSGDKYVGYLPFSSVYEFTVPSLPIEEETESVPTLESSSTEMPANNYLGETLQLVIIIAVSLVAISIVYVLFRPSKTKARDEVISLNEFDDE